MNVINVGKPSLESHHLLYMWEFIQVINLTNVKYVGKPSVKAHLLLFIWEAIQVRSPMVVMNVEKPSLSSQLLLYIWESTLEKNLIGVVNVGKLLARSLIILDTREFILIKALWMSWNQRNLQQNLLLLIYETIRLKVKWHECGKSFSNNSKLKILRILMSHSMKTWTSTTNINAVFWGVISLKCPWIQSWTLINVVLEGLSDALRQRYERYKYLKLRDKIVIFCYMFCYIHYHQNYLLLMQS